MTYQLYHSEKLLLDSLQGQGVQFRPCRLQLVRQARSAIRRGLGRYRCAGEGLQNYLCDYTGALKHILLQHAVQVLNFH